MDAPHCVADDFDFDLTPKTKPVKLGGSPFVLREPDAVAGARYRNAQAAARLTPDGKPRPEFQRGFDGLNEAGLVLLEGCLFEANGEGKPGPRKGMDFVRGLPARVAEPLVEWCREAGGFNQSEGEEKN